MDESGARLVHGGAERFGDLATLLCRHWNWRPRFGRIQSARVRDLSGHLFGDCGAGHRRIEIGRGSSSAKTSGECAHGAVAKGASEDSYALQETGHSLFRFLGPHPLRTIVSVWPRGKQHHRGHVSYFVLPAPRLALLVRHLGGRLFPNLSRRTLAQRRCGYAVSRNR